MLNDVGPAGRIQHQFPEAPEEWIRRHSAETGAGSDPTNAATAFAFQGFYRPVAEIRMSFAAGQLAVFQGANDEHI